MSKSRPPVELSGRHHNLPRGHVGGRSGGSSRGSMTEFLVEVTPGRELRYRSSLSFRLAIRSAEIPPEARIFHRARRTWLPITAHPEYRRIQAEQTAPHWLLPTFPASAEEGDASAARQSAVVQAAGGLRLDVPQGHRTKAADSALEHVDDGDRQRLRRRPGDPARAAGPSGTPRAEVSSFERELRPLAQPTSAVDVLLLNRG